MNNPLVNPISSAEIELGGPVAKLLTALTDQWLLVAPMANPAMLEMFADRDHQPYRNLLPWSGEFAGKYLTSAIKVLRLTRDERLESLLGDFVNRLAQLQDVDGYLGPWPNDSRLTNFSPHHGTRGIQTWDTWGHYQIMIGLILWAEETRDSKILECACRMADLICQKYLGKKRMRLVDTGSTEMNLAPVHALAKLYRMTEIPRYLDMALQIVDEFGAIGPEGPLAGDYLRQALAGKALFQMPKPRWESLHPILGLAELYWVTGDDNYRKAFEHIWWSIVENDRHNNGGFSSGEQAVGNPYAEGTIETCCTIAWIAMSIEMLRMTRNSVVADEIELSTLNSVLGMHSPTGRWATFTTPSDGARFASSHAIVFQARSGSPELNCCSVNSPRGLGMISDWAIMQHEDDLVLNYFGPSDFKIELGEDLTLKIRQETDYPVSGRILFHVSPSRPTEITLSIRVPYWSEKTYLSLNQQALEGVRAGEYFQIRREWKIGDILEMNLDMTPHYWRGEKQCNRLVSVYKGPILLAYDQRYNPHTDKAHRSLIIPDDPFKVTKEYLPGPIVDADQSMFNLLDWKGTFAPLILLEAKDLKGQIVRLCDFASAGMTGTLYRSWIPIINAPPRQRFSRSNPLRSVRK